MILQRSKAHIIVLLTYKFSVDSILFPKHILVDKQPTSTRLRQHCRLYIDF